MRIRRRSQDRAGGNRPQRTASNNDRDSMSRGEPTDLAPTFQECDYDLLHGNPPSNNPNFVPFSDHQFVGRYSNSNSNSTDRIQQRNDNIDNTGSSQTDWRSAFRENHHDLLVDNQPSDYFFGTVPASDHQFVGRYSSDDQHLRRSGGNSSFDQFESSTAFQERHYDLLVGNPPSRNPSFVPACRQDQLFPGQSTASSEASSSFTPAIVSPLGSGGGNPFEQSFVPASDARVRNFESLPDSESFGSSFGAGCTGAGVGTHGPSAYPVAAAVVVPDTERDSAIPFVDALRIDDEIEIENEIIERGCHGIRRVSDASGLVEEEPDIVEATSVRPLCRPPPLKFPPQPSRIGPNVRETRNREGRSRMASVIRASPPASGTLPPWNPPMVSNNGRPLPSSYFPEERRTSGSSNHKNSRRISGGGNRAGWSRVSVQARAAAGEARRSLEKKIGKESKKFSKELAKEQEALSKSIARSAKELAREQKALSRRVREEMARQQKLAVQSMLPFRRR